MFLNQKIMIYIYKKEIKSRQCAYKSREHENVFSIILTQKWERVFLKITKRDENMTELFPKDRKANQMCA